MQLVSLVGRAPLPFSSQTIACLVMLLAVSTFLAGCRGRSAADPPRSAPTTRSGSEAAITPPPGQSFLERDPHPLERRLRNLRQLTFGGENAEAYFSADGQRLIFQSTRPPYECDQIFTMKTDGSDVQLVSTGLGRTTCAFYYYPDDRRILYASTHLTGADCPPPPDRSRGYVWPLHEGYEVFSAAPDGSDLVNLTRSPGYDAEATFAFDGSRIVFTSTRDDDLDIYTMDPDGSDVRRLTTTPGYDGGAFYSYDNEKIIYRCSRPEGAALEDYRQLLAQGLVRPSRMELWIMNADGSDQRPITDNGKANFAPFLHPDGERVIFSSNLGSESGREFDIYMIRTDGTGLERITYTPEFDGFPMFTPDGERLVFCSNRHHGAPGETNVFIADWVE